jgi:hypothetical protein
MPIIVKDFNWTQSESKLCISLPLKGTKASNLDIINSLDFVKVKLSSFTYNFLIHINSKKFTFKRYLIRRFYSNVGYLTQSKTKNAML